VGGIEGNAMKGSWWISYHCEPVESENEAVVTLELGTDEYYAMRGDFEVLRNAVMRLRPHAPSLFWAQSSVLNLHDSHPATRLVQDWLLSDLRNAGWGP
jgi:hypothetical protein